MSAGLPGLGLGGLFFILSALFAPLAEVVRIVRGRSDAARRRQIGRQFLLALAMLVAIDLTLRGLLLAGALVGAGSGGGEGIVVMPLAPIGITTGLLLLVLAGAKGADVMLRMRDSHRERSLAAQRRRASAARRARPTYSRPVEDNA
jgi:hypothetical protein